VETLKLRVALELVLVLFQRALYLTLRPLYLVVKHEKLS
jgi:hypothetical protein